MKANPILIEKINEKYEEMLKNKIYEDFFDKEYFGELKIFINNEPQFTLFFVKIESNMVYLGSENL